MLPLLPAEEVPGFYQQGFVEENQANRYLGEAARRGDVGAVRKALAAGADINARFRMQNRFYPTNKDIVTALMIAVDYNRLSVIRLLLEQGADVNIRDDDGDTALVRAVNWKFFTTVRLLLEKDANPNVQDDLRKTPLMKAAAGGSLAITDLLIQNGANINAQDRYGETALIYAVHKNKPRIVTLLLYRGADPFLRERSFGLSALDWARRENRPKIVKIIADFVRERQTRALMEEKQELPPEIAKIITEYGTE